MGMTISEIAKQAGVCCATVSRVVNHSGPVKKETREKVEAVIRQHNYVPHTAVKTGNRIDQNSIAVIFPDLSNPFFSEAVRGINTAAYRQNFNVMFYDSDENQDREIQLLKHIKNQAIKGLIIAPATDTDEFNGEYLKLLESMGIPIYLVDRDVKYSNFDGVFIDNVRGAFDATDALIKAGHKDIAYISGPKTSRPGRDRLRGFYKAFWMNHLTPREDLIFYGDFRMDSGYELTEQILQAVPRATAIFVSNNLMSLGALKSLKEHHMEIPDDISFLMFDEIAAATILGMGLSYVERPTSEMGQFAVEQLVDKIKSKNTHNAMNRTTLIPHLHLEGSEKRMNGGVSHA